MHWNWFVSIYYRDDVGHDFWKDKWFSWNNGFCKSWIVMLQFFGTVNMLYLYDFYRLGLARPVNVNWLYEKGHNNKFALIFSIFDFVVLLFWALGTLRLIIISRIHVSPVVLTSYFAEKFGFLCRVQDVFKLCEE